MARICNEGNRIAERGDRWGDTSRQISDAIGFPLNFPVKRS